jgi:hypothetical protein
MLVLVEEKVVRPGGFIQSGRHLVRHRAGQIVAAFPAHFSRPYPPGDG